MHNQKNKTTRELIFNIQKHYYIDTVYISY